MDPRPLAPDKQTATLVDDFPTRVRLRTPHRKAGQLTRSLFWGESGFSPILTAGAGRERVERGAYGPSPARAR
jgi:hypothetical protein